MGGTEMGGMNGGIMKHYQSICLMAMLTVLVSCGATRKMPANETWRQDSIRVEVRTEMVYIPDTVYIEIPAQVAERTTRDSTSRLENDYATSEARINTDGTLYHDLKTKPQKKAVETLKPVERNDSIIYRYKDRTVVETVEVERKLSWWQQTQIYGFYVALAVILIAYRKNIFSIIKQFL